jgi:hypothetical protein
VRAGQEETVSMQTKKPKATPITHWDRPAHFIGSADCRFGLADVVNGHIVSTVGDYHPAYGDGRRREIGYDRFYETMVAKDSGKRCEIADCPCGGIPEPVGSWELDFDGYQTEREARLGHAAMVAKYAAMSSTALKSGA